MGERTIVNKANIMLLLAIALWGMTIAPTKWAMESFPPLTLTFLRLFVASLLFLPFAWRKARKEAGSELVIPWRRMCSLSFTGVAGYFLFNYLGVAQTSGLHASIISALLPLCTMLMAAFYLKERMVATQWLGLLAGLAGVLLVSAQPSAGSEGSWWGDLLSLISYLIWAIYVIQLKRPKGEERLPSVLFTALTLAIGAVMIFPFMLGELILTGIPSVTPKSIVSLLILVLGPTIAAYWLWNRALESISAGKAALYLNAMPVISVLASILLLSETFTWQTGAGGLLVLSGVLWSEKKDRLKALPTEV